MDYIHGPSVVYTPNPWRQVALLVAATYKDYAISFLLLITCSAFDNTSPLFLIERIQGICYLIPTTNYL